MTTSTHQHTILPRLFDWAEQFPPLFMARSLISPYPIPVEGKVERGHYLVRAELPGIDPVKDLKITIGDRLLVIEARRTEDSAEKIRSEFQYGAFRREMVLPVGANLDAVAATYADGILKVSIGLGESAGRARQIPVVRGCDRMSK